MPTLDDATRRLNAALDRLEGALGKPATAAQPAPTRGQGDLFAADERDALRKQLAKLTAERDGLKQELDAAQQENTRLQGLTAELSNGLDHAIGELKTVLED
jgi:uncharacterized protein (DUF3084 family)